MLNLTDKEQAVVASVLRQFESVTAAAVFGSRATGEAKQGSDVDIALFGPVSGEDVASVRLQLNEGTFMPYFFDVIGYNSITSAELKKHIHEFGIKIYARAGAFAQG